MGIPLSLTLRVAVRALLTNKFRSFLTILGIIIGVAALIATWSISQGAKFKIQEKLDQFGKDSVWVFGGNRAQGGSHGGARQSVDLKVSDWEVLSQLSSVQFSCPVIWGEAQLVYGSSNWHSDYAATTPEYTNIRKWPLATGRMFSADEIRSGATVAVLGTTVVDKLFGSSQPLGKMIRIQQFSFTVVGVLEERGQEGGRTSQDDFFMVPYTTAQRRLRKMSDISAVLLSSKNSNSLKALAVQAVDILKQKNSVPAEEKDAYEAHTAEQAFKTYKEGTQTFGILTLLTATVCLLVGGIGITNTMMMSVGERTREIGVRLALGARPNDILLQFLCEAVLLSGLGGALGVALGFWGATESANLAAWPPVITISSLVISFVCATMIGLVSGVYPAWRASRLDPVEALRNE